MAVIKIDNLNLVEKNSSLYANLSSDELSQVIGGDWFGGIVGGATGAVTGGTLGFIAGGPVGALMGGITLGYIGIEAGSRTEDWVNSL